VAIRNLEVKDLVLGGINCIPLKNWQVVCSVDCSLTEINECDGVVGHLIEKVVNSEK
jgi:hypothetical protein